MKSYQINIYSYVDKHIDFAQYFMIDNTKCVAYSTIIQVQLSTVLTPVSQKKKVSREDGAPLYSIFAYFSLWQSTQIFLCLNFKFKK